MFASSTYFRLLWVKSHPKHEDMVIILIGGGGGGTGRLVGGGGGGGWLRKSIFSSEGRLSWYLIILKNNLTFVFFQHHYPFLFTILAHHDAVFHTPVFWFFWQLSNKQKQKTT